MELMDLPPEVISTILQQLISTGGVSTAWQARGICQLFREEIKKLLLQSEPQGTFDSDPSIRPHKLYVHGNHVMTPGAQALLLRLMPQILHAKVNNPRGFDNALPNCIMGMYRGVCGVLGHEAVLSALLTSTPVSNIVKHLDPDWFAALGTGSDIHSQITAAIALHRADYVQMLLPQLGSHSEKHLVFGSPLINAIKLKNLDIVEKIVKYLQRFHFTESDGKILLTDSTMAFPIHEAIHTAICYNSHEILGQLAKLMYTRFRPAAPADFNDWIWLVARNSNYKVLKSLYDIEVQPQWKLSLSAVTELCKTENYKMIHFALVHGKYNHSHRSSRWHPFHVAVRNGIDAAKAVFDTDNHDVNEAVKCDFYEKWDEPVTALDVAIYRDDTVTMRWLLEKGAEYQRRFPPAWMSGRVYNCIRRQAIEDSRKNKMLPSFGQYQAMSVEAQMGFTFEVVE
ncbi:hypothetical protein DDE82_002069 [Stemphylium lycopersici]|nr:hypothetical protein TW65_04745 [Stemphylium lycopersici]RAR08780.1 hypothetical protein DDE82_002069 [Stemphylium lycopersici]